MTQRSLRATSCPDLNGDEADVTTPPLPHKEAAAALALGTSRIDHLDGFIPEVACKAQAGARSLEPSDPHWAVFSAPSLEPEQPLLALITQHILSASGRAPDRISPKPLPASPRHQASIPFHGTKHLTKGSRLLSS